MVTILETTSGSVVPVAPVPAPRKKTAAQEAADRALAFAKSMQCERKEIKRFMNGDIIIYEQGDKEVIRMYGDIFVKKDGKYEWTQEKPKLEPDLKKFSLVDRRQMTVMKNIITECFRVFELQWDIFGTNFWRYFFDTCPLNFVRLLAILFKNNNKYDTNEKEMALLPYKG